MKQLISVVVASANKLWSLLVDDGFLAVAALAAIAAAYLLSRDAALGPVNAAGWILVGMIGVPTVISVRRAMAARERSE